MAGHSKWANIKHKKGRADAAREDAPHATTTSGVVSVRDVRAS